MLRSLFPVVRAASSVCGSGSATPAAAATVSRSATAALRLRAVGPMLGGVRGQRVVAPLQWRSPSGLRGFASSGVPGGDDDKASPSAAAQALDAAAEAKADVAMAEAVAGDSAMEVQVVEPTAQAAVATRAEPAQPPRKKFKSPRKRAGHVMNELTREAAAKAAPVPDFEVGDALQVAYRHSKSAPRPTVVRGVVIGRRNQHHNSGFKLLCVVDGFRVEFNFPLYNPMIDEIRVLMPGFINKFRKSKSTRAKLYYLRDGPMRKYTVTLANTGNAVEEDAKKSKRMRKKGDRAKQRKKEKKRALREQQ